MDSSQKHSARSLEDEQKQREQREAVRAVERAANQHSQLKAAGRESRTSYGHALFDNYAELVSLGIEQFLARKLDDPYTAGPHHGAWPLLLHFCRQGPRGIGVIALTCVIDRISTVSDKKKLATIIGRALQDELNGTVLHDSKGALLLQQVKRHYGRKTVTPRVMRQLQLAPTQWLPTDKRELGCLVIDLIRSSSTLIEEKKQGKKTLIVATDEVKELIRSSPPRALSIRRLPSLLPPNPRVDVTRNGRRLVTSRKPMDLSHIDRDSVRVQIEVINALEQQEMRLDPWMAAVQRQAWDETLPLFSVRREPDPKQPRIAEDARIRARIEETMRQGEEVAGRPIFLECDMDFRGRIYTASRMVGHQGPDYSKALIEFGVGAVASEHAFESMLMGAAGHFGLGRKSWDERLRWGKQNLQVLKAIAKYPLDRMDLWKDASDPWQLLQAAKAISDWLEDPTKKMHVPVRFDQTCSGMGIIACLTRDRELARLTNIFGDRREDLYAAVAGDLMEMLQRDLHGFDFRSARMAETWLKHEITRDLTKGPTMTQIYGARHFGIVEQLCDWLMEKKPGVSLSDWDKEYTWPSQYLAHKLNIVIGHKLKSCVALETWLRGVSRACTKRQQRIRFITPMDFPVSLGSELEAKKKQTTLMNGSKRWESSDDCVVPGELSARATSRGITANVIHAFDASYCSAVVQRMKRAGEQVITNHDCFATLPSSASMMQNLLMNELSAHYKPDWLTDIHDQIELHAGVDLPAPPFVSTLCEGEIGQNPYCFS